MVEQRINLWFPTIVIIKRIFGRDPTSSARLRRRITADQEAQGYGTIPVCRQTIKIGVKKESSGINKRERSVFWNTSRGGSRRWCEPRYGVKRLNCTENGGSIGDG
jgi:hypothetical protein